MKHWDGRDRDDVIELRPTRPDVQRLVQMLQQQPKPKRHEPQLASLFGLVLALALLGGLSWAVAPGSPVSADLLD